MLKVRTSLISVAVLCVLVFVSSSFIVVQANYLSSPLYTWVAEPLFQLDIAPLALNPTGFSPVQMRTAYNLPSTGGAGRTIAIVTAYDAPTVQSDLTVFSNQFGLPVPTADNFEIHKMSPAITTDSGWALETALDVQWAHAIAPQAKILLVEAKTALLVDLFAAVDYARSRSDVVSISMSWGSDEFYGQSYYNYHFTSSYGASFFAASGDDGAGLIWPASSSNVIAVGGTTLSLFADGSVSSETSWSGSGGGVSAYESRPSYQTDFGITTRRAVPDVSYNANPATGVSVYTTSQGWVKVGGTSAGSPQWAAIHALGLSATHNNFYRQAKSSSYNAYFRDITSGSNGYTAVSGYDYVTGLGSPVTISFGQTSQIIPINTSITLIPVEQTTSLSSSNQFAASYRSNGVERITYLQDGTSTLSVDTGTNVVISGTSTASTEQEKWVFTSNANAATTTAGSNLSLSYYQLLAQPMSYTIIGGGNPQSPAVTYYTAPATVAAQESPQTSRILLSQIPQTVWSLKGTTVSVVNPLTLSSSERWITTTATWITTTPNQLPSLIQYIHQYLLSTSGAQTSSQWYNSDETAQIAIQGVFNRASGTGQRITSYSVDAGAAINIQPTTGIVIIPILMNAAHQLNINSVKQHQITLDSEATNQLSLITLPAISGDAYWYDEGTTVLVTFNGVTNRQSGTCNRLTAYTVNGAATTVLTAVPVQVLNTPIYSPQSISATVVPQYQLSTPSGSVKTVTAPTILGDAGWYDAETNVVVTYDYSWKQNGTESRLNAISFTVNQAAVTLLDRSGSEVFIVQVTLTEPKTINIISVTQYYFIASGSPNIQLAPNSPTADGFFDAGSTITVTTAYVWDTAGGNSRQRLVSYTLNSEIVPISQAEEDRYSTPEISFNSSHKLTFNSLTQYLVSFQFQDSSGTTQLLPTTLQIKTDNANSYDLSTSSVWLDSGTQIEIEKITWQGSDVKPTVPIGYFVNAPLSDKIVCQVYSAKLEVKDLLNLSISGAQVTVALANQTTIQTTTGADGAVDLGLIPLGTFDATVSYFTESTSVAGNTSSQPIVTARIFASASVLGIAASLAVAVISSVLFIRRRLSIAPKNTTKQAT